MLTPIRILMITRIIVKKIKMNLGSKKSPPKVTICIS
jgi:hypothetical protein